MSDDIWANFGRQRRTIRYRTPGQASTNSNNAPPHTSPLAEAINEVWARNVRATSTGWQLPDPRTFQRYPDPVPRVIYEVMGRRRDAISRSGQGSYTVQGHSDVQLLAIAISSVLAARGMATDISHLVADIDDILAQNGQAILSRRGDGDPHTNLLAAVIRQVLA